MLKSLDAVLNHILASGKGGAPRAVLVAGVIGQGRRDGRGDPIARALVARREQVVLVDLTRGPAAVSGPLGLPRAPGLTDLAAGRAGFEDVVRIDADTPLQVITAGNPKVKAKGEETERFTRVFEALTQAYDCVVLHADREAVRKLTPALKFELPVVVAVLPAGASARATNDRLDRLLGAWLPGRGLRANRQGAALGLARPRRGDLKPSGAGLGVAEQARAKRLRQRPQMPVRFDRALEARHGCERQRQE